MEKNKNQITDLLQKHSSEVFSSGSCGELGDSFMAIDENSFSDLADEILQNFEPKKCMPDDVNSKEEHKQYLKDIRYDEYIKKLEHHKDTTCGLYAFDFEPKELLNKFNNSQSDANPIECSEFEELIKRWELFCNDEFIGKSPFFKIEF